MRRLPPTPSLLALTGVAVALEVGLLVACLSSGTSPLATGCVLAVFHTGYLFADRVGSIPAERLRPAAASAAFGAMVVLTVAGPYVALVPVLVASASLQALRRQLKRSAKPRVGHKNFMKFMGMCVAGAAVNPLGLLAIGAVGAVLALLAHGARSLPQSTAEVFPVPPDVEWRLLVVEFLHHAHYFLYCYTFWRLMPDLPAWAVGPLFTVGWLAYFVAEAAIGRRVPFAPGVIAAGHILCAVCIAAMLGTSAPVPLMLLWFLTGVGGGTAYMLANGPQAHHRERAEDSGHVLGTLAGGILAAMAVSYSIVAAAIVAFATALFSIALSRRLLHVGGRPDARK